MRHGNRFWLTAVGSTLAEGLLVEDEGRHIVFANPALLSLFGLSMAPAALSGVHCREIAGEVSGLFEDPAGFRRSVGALIEAWEPVKGDVLTMTDGRIVERDFFPLQDEDGGRAGCVWTFRDVTSGHQVAEELEQAKEQSEAASQAKSDFLAHISHEMRTPLNAIAGLTEVVLGMPLEPTQRSHLERVASNATALTHLISDVLDFSTIEARRMELDRLPIDIDRVVGAAVETCSLAAESKGLRLLVASDHHMPSQLFGDPTRVRQVVLNLLQNAIRYTSEGSVRVSVRLAPSNQTNRIVVKLAVTDTGEGIAPDQLTTIFERFQRVGRDGPGVGLGLSITQSLVDLMGGTIRVRSKLGRGSRFVVELPMEVASFGNLLDAAGHLDGRVALVVDDFEPGGEATAKILEQAGASVHHCRSDEALDQLSTRHHHFVVVDRDAAERLDLEPILRPVASRVTVLLDGAGNPLASGERFDRKLIRPLSLMQLPAMLAPDEPAELEDVVPEVLAPRVLVVDDHPDNLLLVRHLLEPQGLVVVEAESGFQALELMASEAFDLVFMDVDMPRLDGIEVVQRYRSTEEGERVPIVALTAHATEDVRNRCMEAGMDGFLSKPVHSKRLLSAVAEYAKLGPAVLVVDDDADSRRLTRAWLSEIRAIRLVEAVSGEQALDLFANRQIDLVLMDLSLPGMDGVQTAKRLRAMPGGVLFPIIGMTGHGDKESRRRCIQAGMQEVIVKPVRHEDLMNAVQGALGSSVQGSYREIDPDIADLVVEFLAEQRAQLETLSKLAVDGDLREVQRMGHRLKGTGGSYGFPELTELGGKLEDAAREGDRRAVVRAARKLASVLRSIR